MSMWQYLKVCSITVLLLMPAILNAGVSNEPLYEVIVGSSEDAESIRDSGVEVILRGENRYLIHASAEAIDKLEENGVEQRLVLDSFEADDWVILSSEDRSFGNRELSLSLSEENRFLFDNSLIVKREHAERLAESRRGIMMVSLPSFVQPVEYTREYRFNAEVFESALIDSIGGLVSKDSIETYTRRLEAFVTRYSHVDSVVAARDWLMEKFTQFGYDPVIDSFQMANLSYGEYAYNVAADHTGTTAPEILIIICGHYDSTAGGVPELNAPGADDNASGTAYCLEIARVLKGFDTPKTVRFICFSGEEQGLLGSAAYVESNPGLNIEVVINADMIGYTANDDRRINIFHQPYTSPHADFVRDMIIQETDLDPQYPGGSDRSDHASFRRAGYRAMFVGEYLAYPFYHTVNDISDKLDFEYMTDIIKGCAAATYAISEAPPVVEGLQVTDPGNGDRLLVEWNLIEDTRDFDHELMIGTISGAYTTSIHVPKGESSYTIDQLVDGTSYYIAARTVIDDTLSSIAVPEESGTPVSIPHPATDLTASPAFRGIELSWKRSIHTDIAGYRILRSPATLNQFTDVATVDDSTWIDSDIEIDNYYDYIVVAVDQDSNESLPIDTVTSRGAFFEQDLLVVIVPPVGIVTDTAASMARYRNCLADIRYDLMLISSDPVPVETLGQYRSVMWIDDGMPRVYSSLDALRWVTEYGTNLLLCGPFVSSELNKHSSTWLGLEGYSGSHVADFVFASRLGDWPDALVDTSMISLLNSDGNTDFLRGVSTYEFDPEIASAIYLYQSTDPAAAMHDQPCGLYAEVDSSVMVLLGFPLMHLEAASGRAIINQVADLFEIPRDVAGDVNDDSRYSLLDIGIMLKMLYWDYPMPNDANVLDVNNDCLFDLLDLTYMLSYIFLGGAPPTYGCIDTE